MFLLGFLGRLGLGNHGENFPGDLIELGFDFVQNRVNLGLIQDIYLGNGEKTDPGDEDQGHGIEPASNVGENPQRQTKLDGIKHVLNKKETSEFEKGTVQFGRSVVGEAVHFFLGNLQVEFSYFGERIAGYLFLQESYHNIGVYLEGQYCQQGCQ